MLEQIPNEAARRGIAPHDAHVELIMPQAACSTGANIPAAAGASNGPAFRAQVDALTEPNAETADVAAARHRAVLLNNRYTEAGNARRLVALHGRDLRYSHPWGKWLVWDGKRWHEDNTGEAMRRAKATVRAIYDVVSSVEDGEIRKKLSDWARKSDSSNGLAAALRLASSEPNIPVLPEEMDRDPFLLTVANGTVDLRTGALRPHRREDLITKATPIAFDAHATCPTWEAFLARVLGDDWDVIEFVQKLCGYVLTGSTSEQAIFYLYGHGANGKSVFLRVLQTLLGDYAVQAPASLLVASNNDTHPTELARLFGQRLAICTELERGARLAESRVKQLSGEDRIAARRMREDFWEFESTCKLVIGSNYKPEIRGTDEGIWRRQRLIPFDVTIPESERDPNLFAKLQAEMPGILRWALDGCRLWLAEGMKPPAAVVMATSEYRAEQDVLHDFLTTCCAFTPGATVTKARLRSAYEGWAAASAAEPVSVRDFKDRLTAKAEITEARSRLVRSWAGIELTTEGVKFAEASESARPSTYRRTG